MSSKMTASRRSVLRALAAAALTGPLPLKAAQHVHHQTAQAKRKADGAYKPKLFNEHEWATLRLLSDYIIPQDEVSPGALAAGAPEYIDLLASHNQELAALYTGGLAWIDRQMEKRYGAPFVKAGRDAQRALLDLIAYRKNDSPELRPGIRFFDWLRRMVVDAFYTSPVGIKDLGYLGNKGAAQFVVPAESLQYALKRSGLA